MELETSRYRSRQTTATKCFTAMVVSMAFAVKVRYLILIEDREHLLQRTSPLVSVSGGARRRVLRCEVRCPLLEAAPALA